MNIVFSPMNKNYFTTENVDCSYCRQPIEKIIIHCYCWTKKRCIKETYCINCYNKMKNIYIVMEKKTIILVDDYPDDSIPIVNRPPVLATSRDMTVFEVADKQVADESVIDKTKYAGRPEGSWIGIQIGQPDMKLLKVKDKALSQKEGIKLLEKLK